MGCGQGNGRGLKEGENVTRLADSSQARSLAGKARRIKEEAEEMLARLREANLAFQAPLMSQHSQTSPERVQSRGQVAVIDMDSCMCCWMCINVCPEQAVTMTDRIEVDWNKCTGCGSCVDECPTEAITISEPAQSVAS